MNEKYGRARTYVLQNSLNLSCNFQDDKPMDKLTLMGFYGTLWLGKPKEEGTVLLPDNLFFLELTEDRGEGVSKIPTPPSSETN